MLSVVEIELQALVTEREGMVAYNQYRGLRGETVAYPDEAFLELAERIRALKLVESMATPGNMPTTPCQHTFKVFATAVMCTRCRCVYDLSE